MPICAPSSVPTTCAMTAPGPSTGEMNGIAQMSEMTSIPGSVLANGEMVVAMTLPSPDTLMMPRIIETNAMNGRMLLIVMSMVSRPAA